jgi:hypothetical protein
MDIGSAIRKVSHVRKRTVPPMSSSDGSWARCGSEGLDAEGGEEGRVGSDVATDGLRQEDHVE